MEKDEQSLLAGQRVLDTVKGVIVGKDDIILRVMLAILAKGHILLEDMPGVGKTTLALAFSKALGLKYSRMQFTPDVLPSDVTGFSVYNKETGRMVYTPGAIICNLFLADELNRATSRAQSALLEAMEEGQVTVDGVSHPIPHPFTVIATQNPLGAAGTQLLPDSQLDRFMVRLSMGYPAHDDEVLLLRRKASSTLLDNITPVLTGQDLELMCDQVEEIYMASVIYEYIVSLVTATRSHPDILQGASPRASIALVRISKAMAYLQGRDFVIPKDIAPIFADTISHRLILRPGAEQEKITASGILKDIRRAVKAPKI